MNSTRETTKLIPNMARMLNFGGWAHIRNANIVTANESKYRDRTVGFFGSLILDWKLDPFPECYREK